MHLTKLIKKNNFVIKQCFFFALGALSSLSLPPTNFLPSIFLLSFGIHYYLKSKNSLNAFSIGLMLGFGWFSLSLYWISNSLIVGGPEYYWMFPFSIILFPLFLSVFWGISFLISFKVSKFLDQKLLLLVIFWTLFEYLRGTFFSGFPWNMPGFSLSSNLFMAQTVSVFGIYGQNLLVFILLVSPIFWVNNFKKHAIIFSLFTIFLIGFSGLRIFQPSLFESNKFVRIVQPSINIKDKWNRKSFNNNIEKLVNLSNENNVLPNIIIWPETALTRFPEMIEKEIINISKRILKNENSLLFTGSITREMDFKKNKYNYYNSILVIDKKGEILDKYNKTRLVPFGEYFPLRNLFPFLKTIVGDNDFSPGLNNKIFKIEKLGYIKPIICYESVFPLKNINEFSPDFILNVTNDYWFGKSRGPEQHLFLTRNRAIENGIPLIRAANNGISVVFDSYGRVIKRLELDENNFLDIKLPKKTKETVYSKWGEKPTISIIIIIIILIIYKKFKRMVDPLNVF